VIGVLIALAMLAIASPAVAQSDPFQAVRPTEPARPITPPADASRSAPPAQPGLRVAPPPGGIDGVWTGQITCDPIGESRTLVTAFTLTITGGAARYERRIFDPRNSQWLGDYERGAGRASPDGNITLNGSAVGQGSAAGSRGQMTYSGRAGGNTLTLSGHQNWTNPQGRPAPPRPCTIRLSRG
jgi:hypothetical protein